MKAVLIPILALQVILGAKFSFSVEPEIPPGDELQRVPAELFTGFSIDWLLEWRDKHFSVISSHDEDIVAMLVRFGGSSKKSLETVLVSEVRAKRKGFSIEPLKLNGYQITRLITSDDETKTADVVVQPALIRKLTSEIWRLVSSAKIDSQETYRALGKDEIWYVVAAKLDDDGVIRSTHQMGQANNPPHDGLLYKIREELLTHLKKKN
jgi:hypothetical protein